MSVKLRYPTVDSFAFFQCEDCGNIFPIFYRKSEHDIPKATVCPECGGVLARHPERGLDRQVSDAVLNVPGTLYFTWSKDHYDLGRVK